MAGKVLKVNVVLADPKTGEAVVFEAGEEKLPAWAAKEIGDHCFEDKAPARRASTRQKSSDDDGDDSGDAGGDGSEGDKKSEE